MRLYAIVKSGKLYPVQLRTAGELLDQYQRVGGIDE